MTNGSKLMNAGVHIKYGLEGLVSPFRFILISVLCLMQNNVPSYY